MSKPICRILILMFLFTDASGSSHSQSILETIEWTWAAKPETPDPTLPNILFLGDSITRGYYPAAAKLLTGQANCYLFATSASSGDPRLIKQVKEYFAMMRLKFAIIHFNNGMHGWKYTETEYAAGLPSLVETLHQSSAASRLVWANTTPVRNGDPTGASNPRIEDRNARALAIMSHTHVAIDDQYSLMAAHDDLHSGAVHYTAMGSEVQAQQVTNILMQQLHP
jgi:hypothetical protein